LHQVVNGLVHPGALYISNDMLDFGVTVSLPPFSSLVLSNFSFFLDE
jgi:hypothetical protein